MKLLGERHPDVAMSIANFGMVQRKRGQLAGAQDALGRALAIFERALAPDHPSVLITRRHCAIVAKELAAASRQRRGN
jgi:Tfp pilus assembly protein PilF